MLGYRLATWADRDLYYKWVNDAQVRHSSFNTASISYEEHCNWFRKKIESSDSLLIIFMKADLPIGQVRIDLIDGVGVVDISIENQFRGLKMGREMLTKMVEIFWKQFGEISVLAKIKNDNIASKKLFLSAGFKLMEDDYQNMVSIYEKRVDLG